MSLLRNFVTLHFYSSFASPWSLMKAFRLIYAICQSFTSSFTQRNFLFRVIWVFYRFIFYLNGFAYAEKSHAMWLTFWLAPVLKLSCVCSHIREGHWNTWYTHIGTLRKWENKRNASLVRQWSQQVSVACRVDAQLLAPANRCWYSWEFNIVDSKSNEHGIQKRFGCFNPLKSHHT